MASATIAAGPPRAVTSTVQPIVFRIVLYASGTVALATGIAMTLVAGLGLGPSDVFIGAVAGHLDIGHGTATSAFIATVLVAGLALGSRPGPGTVVTAVALGPLINVAASVLAGLHTGVVAADAVTSLIGVVAICMGVGLVICAEVGRGAMELFVDRAAARLRRGPSLVRTGIEASLLVAGIALSGPIGPVTVVVAVAIGPGIVAAVRHLDRALSAELSVSTIRRLGRPRYTRLQ